MMSPLPSAIGQKKKPARAILGGLEGKFYFPAAGQGTLKVFFGKVTKNYLQGVYLYSRLGKYGD